MALKQIQGSTAPALGSAAAWLPTARTTPPLPAGMTSLRKTRQRPRDMEILWGKRPLASCQRSEEVIGSYSSSFNNKAASLIAFGAELRPLPFCMFPEETFDIAALVAAGNVPADCTSIRNQSTTEKMQLLSLFGQPFRSFIAWQSCLVQSTCH